MSDRPGEEELAAIIATWATLQRNDGDSKAPESRWGLAARLAHADVALPPAATPSRWALAGRLA